MIPVQPTKNSTPHLPEDYDTQISDVIPYYLSFHQEIIYFIKSLLISPKVWLDTGCGTGSLVSKAIEEFPYIKFLLVDPSEGMLDQARKKMLSYPIGRLEFLQAYPTQKFSQNLKENQILSLLYSAITTLAVRAGPKQQEYVMIF